MKIRTRRKHLQQQMKYRHPKLLNQQELIISMNKTLDRMIRLVDQLPDITPEQQAIMRVTEISCGPEIKLAAIYNKIRDRK